MASYPPAAIPFTSLELLLTAREAASDPSIASSVLNLSSSFTTLPLLVYIRTCLLAMGFPTKYVLLVALAVLVLLPAQAHAFGAGNIA